MEDERLETSAVMRRYQKHSLTVEAIQWTGNNLEELQEWGAPVTRGFNNVLRIKSTRIDGLIYIQPGIWVIKEKEGEFYTCLDAIFQTTYHALD
jgi:hypothetical protein